ncbi:MAG: purine-nucleoside phosphorylase [Planctomycetota bacterium]|nr:MAG: purine-nucleoside phosphorylase [Planctomycetota bacterium]
MNPEGVLVQNLAGQLRRHLGGPPEIAVVLGSGWKERAASLLDQVLRLPLQQLQGWPLPRVAGHGTELLLGRWNGHGVVLVGGRVHAYEGHPARLLVRGVRSLQAWGVPRFLLLNAAGSLDPDRRPGSLMPFQDHINFGLPNPLAGDQRATPGSGFLNLVDLYDPEWRRRLLAARPELQAGIYAGLSGPSYETPAEVAYLRRCGADAVGMSTIPEALAVKEEGASVMAISMITNLAAGIGGSQPDHQEVLDTAREHGESAAEVLAEAISAGLA